MDRDELKDMAKLFALLFGVFGTLWGSVGVMLWITHKEQGECLVQHREQQTIHAYVPDGIVVPMTTSVMVCDKWEHPVE